MMYDVVIIGGGPAGCAAAVYTARKRLKTLMITESFGGQSIVSDDIQNWIGEQHISGFDLAQKMEAHVRSFSDPPACPPIGRRAGRAGMVEIKMPEKVTKVEVRNENFDVRADHGNIYQTKAIILAAGARRRKLGVPGEEKFNGKGVAYCSTCDAPLFSGKRVAVIGGGNAGLEAVVDLFPYASEIYLLANGEVLKGDPVEVEEVKKNSKLKEIIFNAEILEIVGDKPASPTSQGGFVTGVKYKNKKTNEEKVLEVGGIFVEIGSVPNSEIVKGLVDIDKWGQIMIDAKHASTSHPGVFAAGDITDDPYKQNNISAGDGVRAALAAYAYLQKRQKISPAME